MTLVSGAFVLKRWPACNSKKKKKKKTCRRSYKTRKQSTCCWETDGSLSIRKVAQSKIKKTL
jgi:hypothetical protein